jgi:L-fuculose-phosphate aldolase
MQAAGLARGTAGNISARIDGGLLISPSAMPYAALGAADIVRIDFAGHVLESAVPPARPSSEWRMHAGILRSRPDISAIVHTHSPFATALACLRRPIPAFHYMVAVAGGSDIPCAPYACFGTAELASHAAAALADRDACLLANHGVVAVGRDVDAALALALEVEGLAEQYTRALQAGEPVLLTEAEMAEALAAFADYRR